jgi:ATP-binding cassette subfamily B (MDR/TAP) protein 1
LLDEATSALDSKTESVVQSAIDAAYQDRTTIMIAHRLSTVRNADNIIVLAQGHVAEVGNYESLIAKNGVYASLVQKQQIQDDAARLPDKEDGKEGVVVSNSVDELDEKSTPTESPDRPLTIKAQESTNPTTDAPSQSTSAKQTLFFIFKMSRENWKMLLFGLICAILAGLTIPAYVSLLLLATSYN